MKKMIIAACTVLALGAWVVSAPMAHAGQGHQDTYYGSPSNVADGGNG